MLTIVKFKAFDKELEKVFYKNETLTQIHQALKEICLTYYPLEITLAQIRIDSHAPAALRALSVIRQQDENSHNNSEEKIQP